MAHETNGQQGGRQQGIRDLQTTIDTYRDMLYKIALMQLKNEQDAEDVVQEVFYQYYKNTPEFASGEHEKAWFIKVTLNGCRRIWRSAWYRHSAPYPEQEMAEESRLESDYLKKEQYMQIWKAVYELPAKYREVIHLFYHEDLSIKEICAVTGRQESTVTSQLTRARDLLKRRLGEEWEFE